MQTCLSALGFPAKKADVLSMLDYHDQDPAEGINYKSFEQILSALYIGRTFDDLVDRAFEVFGSEGKGHITLKGLRRITKDVGQSIDDEELKDMIRMFDKNEDGVIDKVWYRWVGWWWCSTVNGTQCDGSWQTLFRRSSGGSCAL